MNKNNYLLELILSILLIVVLIIFLNPLSLLMPPPLVMSIIVALLLIFGLFSVFVWKERKGDERENYHKILSGHLAFLTGSVILVLGIAYQEINHALDPWLVYVLIGMVVAKIIGHIYSQKKL
jgi:putative flippase GtrA